MHANRLFSVKNNAALKKVICTCTKIQLIVSLPILYLFTNFRGFGLVVFFVLWRKKKILFTDSMGSQLGEGKKNLLSSDSQHGLILLQLHSSLLFFLATAGVAFHVSLFNIKRYLFSSNFVLAPFKPTLFWLTETTLQTGITWKIVKKVVVAHSFSIKKVWTFCFQCFCIYFIIKGECIQKSRTAYLFI